MIMACRFDQCSGGTMWYIKKLLWKQLLTTEKAHQMAHAVKAALTEMFWPTSLSIVISLDLQSGCQTYSSKGELEQACLDKLVSVSHKLKISLSFWHLLHTYLERWGKDPPVSSRYWMGLSPHQWHVTHVQQTIAPFILTPPICDIPLHMIDNYQWGWHKAHESTASSPSGIHFGHYIAGTFNPKILIINTKLVDIPLCTGFSLAYWWKCLNVILKKLPAITMLKNSHHPVLWGGF